MREMVAESLPTSIVIVWFGWLLTVATLNCTPWLTNVYPSNRCRCLTCAKCGFR
jgi:hypothetical protein